MTIAPYPSPARQPAGRAGDAATLAPYLPRVALDWLADAPEETHWQVEGTLLFVDVSGFTALTERLAARGKVGAEEITDVIGTVFGELLGVAATYGADLLKWGGDAVLLYFSEPGSAARACRAAYLMTEAMKRVGRLRTGAGRITLSVSVGAHSGAFDLYLLGDRHRELIITGPAASVTAEMEAAAEAGQVVVSAATAARLDPSLCGAPSGGGVLLLDAPDADVAPRLVRDLGSLEVGRLMPDVRRARLVEGGEEAEHRPATVVFLEFSNIDALTEEGGGRLVAEHLDPVVRQVEAEAERYGIYFHETDIGRDGGKIVLLGGVPLQRGNDVERAVRVAHEIVAGHPRSSPVRLRAGVNAGRVFVFNHNFERAGRKVFAVTGDAVNLAARVMGKAAPGQVVATRATLDRVVHPFETEELPPFRVKGKSQPVVAAAVGPPRATDPETSGTGPFVGRRSELDDILTRAANARRGAGSAITLIGPPGIGKSRLVTEIVTQARLRTLRVACEEYSRAPYRPFRRIFRRLLGVADDAPDTVVVEELRRTVRSSTPQLEPFLPLFADVADVRVPATPETEDLEPRFRRPLLERCVLQLLRAYLARPAILVVEDVHAIDEASASLLSRIADDAPEMPLLVLLTSRNQAGSELPEALASLPRKELAPLGPEAAADLALQAATYDGLLTPAQITAIVERADGNPLFLRELLRSALERGGVDDLPESLEPLLAADIDRLSPGDRQVLRALSVLGTHVDAALVGPVLGPDVEVDDSTWARLGRFLSPTVSGWRFSHDLLRNAAYEGLSFRRRRELHVRAATALEAFGDPDQAADRLSLHWLRAEAWDKTWHYARIAGDRARSLWANADAATFYGRAADASRRLALPHDEVLPVVERLGDVSELTAAYGKARESYTRARRLARSDTDRARLVRKLGVLHEREGRYPSALTCYTRARKMLNRGSGGALIDLRPQAVAELAELDLASAGVMVRSGRYRRGVRFAEQAAVTAERGDHRAQLAHALYLEHVAWMYVGQNRDELAFRALEVFESVGDLVGAGNVLNNLGISAYYRGDWPRSLELFERSRAMRARSGDVVGAATEENNIAENLIHQGRLDQARPLVEAARRGWASAGYAMGVAVTRANLGRLLCRAGRTSEGRPLLEAALEEFRRLHSMYVADTELRIAECELLEGDFVAAAASSQRLLRTLDGQADLEREAVTALRLHGIASTLASLLWDATGPGPSWHDPLDDAVERARRIDDPYELALGLASRAVLGALISAKHTGGPATEQRPGSDLFSDGRREADQIFERLGVERAVITWSALVTGGPIVAVGTIPDPLLVAGGL